MHSIINMIKQIPVDSGGSDWPIFMHSMELFVIEIFHDGLGQGFADNVNTLNSVKILNISLKFRGMTHGAMKQIVIYNGYAQPSLACSRKL